MLTKPQNQIGAISIVLAVLFLAVSAVGISLGLKAVNTPTNLLSKAATCASFNTVWQTPASALNAGQDFTCNATLDPQFSNSKTIVCGWSKNGGWPQIGGRWVGATCNGTNCSFGIRMDTSIDPQASYELVAFDNKDDSCGPSSGKRVPLNVNRPNVPPTSPPQPTVPPGQPTQPPTGGGRCFYLTAQFSLTGEGNYDASVTFRTDDTAVDYHDIQLQKNGVFVAGWNKWTRPSPFTYYPQWTGGRVNRGTSVTYSGIDDVCGLRGNRASIACTINNDGTVSGSGCSLTGTNPPQPTAVPTAIPTTPVGGPTPPAGVSRCNFEVIVKDKVNKQPIVGAQVTDRSRSSVPDLMTDNTGKVTFFNIEKYTNFNLQVTKNGYTDYFETVNLNTSCNKTIELIPLGTNPTPIPTQAPGANRCNFNVFVIDQDTDLPIDKAVVGGESYDPYISLLTDNTGKVTFPNINIIPGFILTVEKEGYNSTSEDIDLISFCGQNTSKIVRLVPKIPTPTPTSLPGTFILKVNLNNKLYKMYQKCAAPLHLYYEIRSSVSNKFLKSFPFEDKHKQYSSFDITLHNVPIPINPPEDINIFLYGTFTEVSPVSFYLDPFLLSRREIKTPKSGETHQFNFVIDETMIIKKDDIQKKCPPDTLPTQTQSLQQKVAQAIQNVGNIFNKNEVLPVKAGAKGKVVVRNSLTTPVEAVYITLHADQKDLEGYYNKNLTANDKGEYVFNLENSGGQTTNPIIKAWARSTNGNWYQNRACKLAGDNFDCSVKAGDNKTLYIDIGPQGLQKFNNDLQKTSQTATENISKFLDYVPLGQYVKMFIISAF